MNGYDIQNHPPVQLEDIDQHRRTVMRILEAVHVAPDLIAAGYTPNSEDAEALQRTYYWADQALGTLATQAAELADMLRQAPTHVDTQPARTLRQAIDERRAFLSVLSSDAEVAAQRIAKFPSLKILVDRAVKAKLEEATARADAMLEEQRARADRFRAESEKRIADLEKEAAEQRARIQIELANARAENERLTKLANAERHARDVKAQNLARNTVDTAEHERKLALAKSPEVRQLLKPFTTPAYYQPRGKTSYEREPISLSTLRQLGALEKTPKGLWRLWKIACSIHDHERPRWAHRDRPSDLTPQQRDDARQAQQYLIELGDELVELGMLSP